MRRFFSFFLSSCQAEEVGNGNLQDQRDANANQMTYCGNSFAITVPSSDGFFVQPNLSEDFVLYRWQQNGRDVIIYEGNFPQPGGIVLRTGHASWPELVVVHGNQNDADAVRIVQTKPRGCKAPKLNEEKE
jgi:hypothetical protein